jgi:hypothetical protein
VQALPATPVPSDAAPAASTPMSRTVVVDEAGEDPDRVRAAADARDDGVRSRSRREELLARLAADHRLQLADDLGYG